MTVIVGYVSTAGAVMASDSQATEEDFTISTENKIWTSHGLLFGYSGQVSLRDALRAELDKRLGISPLPPNSEADMVASFLCVIIRPVLEYHYGKFVGPGELPSQVLGGSLMVIGRGPSGYWLLEIDRNNTDTIYTEGAFHTIGSGALAAHVSQGLLTHYKLPGLEVKHLRLQAYRTVQTCIDVIGGQHGIGGPVQLWQSTSDGFEQVSGTELSAVKDGLEQWTTIEQESLKKVFAEEKEDTGEGLPEPLSDPVSEEKPQSDD